MLFKYMLICPYLNGCMRVSMHRVWTHGRKWKNDNLLSGQRERKSMRSRAIKWNTYFGKWDVMVHLTHKVRCNDTSHLPQARVLDASMCTIHTYHPWRDTSEPAANEGAGCVCYVCFECNTCKHNIHITRKGIIEYHITCSCRSTTLCSSPGFIMHCSSEAIFHNNFKTALRKIKK